MSTRQFKLMLALCVAILVTPSTMLKAAEPSDPPTIRVLLTTGGHAFEEEPFYAMFDAMPGVEYTKAIMPDDIGLLAPGLQGKFDCVVMYDMYKPDLTEKQKAAFKQLLKQGIGLVSLHHNLGAHRNWNDYRKLIGGKFIFEQETIDGVAYETVTSEVTGGQWNRFTGQPETVELQFFGEHTPSVSKALRRD